MATEEQTSYDFYAILAGGDGADKFGQRLTITNRIVSKLGFWLFKRGTPTGNVIFEIRKVSDDSVIVARLWGVGTSLPDTVTYLEVTFNTPALVNEEVRLVCAVDEALEANGARMGYTRTDVKASEYTSYIINHPADGWQPQATWDTAYKYTYESGSYGAPSVTTQAVSSIDKNTATGNGTIVSLGVPAATQHGICWAEFPIRPYYETGYDYTEDGVPSSTGAFTSSMTGLTQNTRYNVRAYIKNNVGTFYGKEVQFTTLPGVPVVRTDLATKVSATTAQGNGSIINNGGSTITQHGFCWGLSEDPTYTLGGANQTEEGVARYTGDFHSLMTELTPDTTYHYRAYAVNDEGTGYGVDKIFKTHAVGAPIVTTQRTTNIQSTSAIGHGTIVDIGGDVITQHGHVWATTENPTISTGDNFGDATEKGAVTDTIDDDNPFPFTSVMDELTIGITYYIRAYATNSFGTSYGDHDIIREVSSELIGEIVVLNEHFAYTSKSGRQRILLGQIN